MKTPTITYAITYEQDDLPVRGNVMCSGDDALDTECENAILAALDRGDVFAWADVTCTASVKYQGQLFQGEAHLGCCSYNSHAELVADCLEQLKGDARVNLFEELSHDIARGFDAADLLKAFDGPDRECA